MDSIIDYNRKTKVELIALCKERGIKGYAKKGFTKDDIIKLLKGENKYNDNCEKVKKNNLFDYLTKNNPSLILKYDGKVDDLKSISYGTMVKYKWKCENYSECSNNFEARPRDVYRNDKKSPTRYCSKCKNKESGKKFQKNMLEKNGSILTKIPEIINVWSEDNIYKPEELTDYSHKIVKLKCPNKSAKHPEYEIKVYNINESNCYKCSKCVKKTSKAEMRIYSELKPNFKDVRWQQKIEGREADITIEDLKLVIEVDGYFWHKDKKEKDLLKNTIFEKNGYTILRIRDSELEKIECETIICNLSNLLLEDYNKIVKWINSKFECDIKIYNEFKNIEYFKQIQAGLIPVSYNKSIKNQTDYLSVSYDNSVEHLFPESKELWDYEKNNPLLPSNFSPGSHTEIWIKCKSGHSFQKPIHSIFRYVKSKKHILTCPECVKPKCNKRIIKVNGKTYKSIISFCKEKNIAKNKLYEKMKQKGIDYSINSNIEKFIEENLESLIRKK